MFIVFLFIILAHADCHRHVSTHSYSSQFRAPHSPSYEYIYIPGDILLGGFFPIHQPPSYELGSMQCTAIKRERGIQRLEAMLFALDVVNTRSSILMKSVLSNTNIRFGALIYDSCDYEPYAIERAFNMLLPSVDQCLPFNQQKESSRIAGVVGSASSIVSMAIADILRLAEIPQVSYASTSTELSEKPRFQFFSRVVPPDTYQAEAVVSIIQFLNWTYVAVIKETGSYGERLTDDFKAKLKNKTICIAGELSVNTKDSNSYMRVIKELHEDEKYRYVHAVVIFAQEDCVQQILNQTSLRNESIGRWVFLGTDGWGKKRYPVQKFGHAAINAITIAPKLYPIPDFDEYFQNLIPSQNKRNPWFVEYWEETYKCKLNQTPFTIFNQNYTRSCLDNDGTYTNFSVSYNQEGYVHYVVDAVFTLVIAIDKLIKEKCSNSSSKKALCQEFYPLDGMRLLSVLRNVSFRNDLSKRSIKFTPNGDGIGTYDIFQYQIINSSDILDYSTIGEFNDNDQIHERVRIDLGKLKWSEYDIHHSRWLDTYRTPRSYCSVSCRPGEFRTKSNSDKCCWTCRPCPMFHIPVNETDCTACLANELPNADFTKCVPIEEEHLSIKNLIAWPALLFSLIGLSMTLYTIFIFIRFSQTPIIKSSSRELSYFLLFGMCCCHLCAWPLVSKPHAITCFFIRIGVGLSLTICLAALLTKTNRLARIFNNKQRLTQPSCLSPRSQLGICAAIVSVQLIGVLCWIFLSRPGVKLRNEQKHNQKRLILVCQTHSEYIACSLVYNMILVISCTLYAIKTRRIPENFNEAKHIGFAMYSICIIWLAFIPIFFGVRSSENWFRIQFVSLAICLSLSATVILLCLFAPKIYVVVFNPSKNIHTRFKKVITQKNASNHLDILAANTMNNRQRRLTASDYTTEVTFCNSKSDVWGGSNINDQMMQTENNHHHRKTSISNGTCLEAETKGIKTDETNDLLSPTRTKANVNCTPQTGNRTSSASNSILSNENPWRKLSNVRYRLDGKEIINENDPTKYQQVYAQHISFV